jgi:hypothetical protein
MESLSGCIRQKSLRGRGLDWQTCRELFTATAAGCRLRRSVSGLLFSPEIGAALRLDVAQTKLFCKVIAGAVGESHDRVRRCFLRMSHKTGGINH